MNLPTTYHYRVDLHLMTLEEPRKSFSHSEVFTHRNLTVARENAVKYAVERSEGLDARKGFYNKDFALPGDWDTKKAARSVVVNLVECNAEYGDIDYPVFGESDEEIREGQALERQLKITD